MDAQTLTKQLTDAANDELLRYTTIFDQAAHTEFTDFIQAGVQELFKQNQTPLPPAIQGAERKARFVIRELCSEVAPVAPRVITKGIWDKVKGYICPLFPFC